MKVLVTGASGLLGSALTRRLAAAGETVRVLLRPTSRRDLLADVLEHVEIATGDVTDPVSLADAFAGVTHAYHCAAVIGFASRRSIAQMMEVNVKGTARVLDAALHARVERVVHVSSVSALGRAGTPEDPVDESAEWRESPTNTAYGRSKYLAELEVHRAVAEGLHATIVNPSLVFGPGRRGENTMKIVEAVRDGRVYGYPAGGSAVVDADDVADGMRSAMRSGEAGERYILSAENLSWREILETLGQAFGVRVPRRRVPPLIMKTAGWIAETVAFATRSEPGLTRETARLSAVRRAFDSSRARRELGWNPRPFGRTADRLVRALEEVAP